MSGVDDALPIRSDDLQRWRRALRSTAVRRAPAETELLLTYWCHIAADLQHLQRKPTDELTTAKCSPSSGGIHTSRADLTGGEIFLRPTREILEAVVTGWRRLAILHFPTNGFLTDRIVASAERIAGRGPGQTVITVSLDGDEQLNDEIRGIKGGFSRQVATFNALRRIPGITVVFGVTL